MLRACSTSASMADMSSYNTLQCYRLRLHRHWFWSFAQLLAIYLLWFVKSLCKRGVDSKRLSPTPAPKVDMDGFQRTLFWLWPPQNRTVTVQPPLRLSGTNNTARAHWGLQCHHYWVTACQPGSPTPHCRGFVVVTSICWLSQFSAFRKCVILIYFLLYSLVSLR